VIAKIPLTDYELTNPFAPSIKESTLLADKVDVTKLAPAVFNLFSYGVCLAGLTTLMSSWDVYRWRTIGVYLRDHHQARWDEREVGKLHQVFQLSHSV
jgi:ABC-2 type transport system permease protein